MAGPALLFDATDGRVLYSEDQDHQWYPASLTKIMTAYLTFEAVKSGRLKLTDKMKVSEKAHEQPPSKVGLPIGAEMGVEMGVQALIVKSANDVAVMLAETVGGSEEQFVQLMNDTARRLGMTKTRFVNANGLPHADQVTTARDLAKLSRAVLRDFPEQAPLWAQVDVQIGRLRLRSHNGLLRSYEGADGLKTGFICDSGFNVVATATRQGRKLVAVVLGEPSGRDRTVRAASLLEHGFQSYDWKQIFNSATIDNMPIAADAKGVVSVRQSVTAWNCNGNGRRIVAKKGKTKAVAAAAAKAKGAKGQPTNKPAAVAAPAAPKAKSATKAE